MLSPITTTILMTVAIVQFAALFAIIFLDLWRAEKTAILALNRNASVVDNQTHIPPANQAVESNFKMAS